jgi:hypothetical protein
LNKPITVSAAALHSEVFVRSPRHAAINGCSQCT